MSNTEQINIFSEFKKLNVCFITVVRSNDNKQIDLNDEMNCNQIYLKNILSLEDLVLLTCKENLCGILLPKNNVTKLNMISIAIDSESGFKQCDKILKTKIVDITPYVKGLKEGEIVDSLNQTQYSLQFVKESTKQMLLALGFKEDINEN